jgi:paraquat-inducible protein A
VSTDVNRPLEPGEHRIGCDVCGLLVPRKAVVWDGRHARCPRCTDVLHHRKPESLQRTWALVIAAIVFYVPANLLPIMTVTSLGRTQSDTILSGVVFLLAHGMWPLAVIVFVASVFVPLLKLLILVFLLVSVQRGSRWRPRERTRLYRITETIGRWSMVDVYVVTILVALVRLGNLASIQAEAGAIFFCAVVILTMLAAMSFDPRLIWDRMGPEDAAPRASIDVTDPGPGLVRP